MRVKEVLKHIHEVSWLGLLLLLQLQTTLCSTTWLSFWTKITKRKLFSAQFLLFSSLCQIHLFFFTFLPSQKMFYLQWGQLGGDVCLWDLGHQPWFSILVYLEMGRYLSGRRLCWQTSPSRLFILKFLQGKWWFFQGTCGIWWQPLFSFLRTHRQQAKEWSVKVALCGLQKAPANLGWRSSSMLVQSSTYPLASTSAQYQSDHCGSLVLLTALLDKKIGTLCPSRGKLFHPFQGLDFLEEYRTHQLFKRHV